MQIEFSFSCRECGEDARVRWDTSHEVPVELFCSACRHVSGELSPAYIFREEHRPSWERVEESA